MYAYESFSYRDPVSKMPKSKRTFLGRVDPVTKEFLDPERAARLKEKHDKEKHPPAGNDVKKSQSSASQDSKENEQFKDELQALKELMIQQNEKIAEIQKSTAKTQNMLTSIADVIQKSVATP
ncbi:MAG: hypothetical protein IJ719_09895 [Clostridia bacterium]|nr:hypothetical protein [Clostridia bacterium]